MGSIGPASWKAVDLSTAGVPHGGRYGDVASFARAMAAHGLTMAWFPEKRVFGLVRKWGPSFKFQVHLCDGNDWSNPTPCTRQLERQILGLWDRHCRTSPDALIRGIEEEDRRRKAEAAERLYLEFSDPSLRRETISRVRLASGKRSRKAFSIPSHLGRN